MNGSLFIAFVTNGVVASFSPISVYWNFTAFPRALLVQFRFPSAVKMVPNWSPHYEWSLIPFTGFFLQTLSCVSISNITYHLMSIHLDRKESLRFLRIESNGFYWALTGFVLFPSLFLKDHLPTSNVFFLLLCYIGFC